MQKLLIPHTSRFANLSYRIPGQAPGPALLAARQETAEKRLPLGFSNATNAGLALPGHPPPPRRGCPSCGMNQRRPRPAPPRRMGREAGAGRAAPPLRARPRPAQPPPRPAPRRCLPLRAAPLRSAARPRLRRPARRSPARPRPRAAGRRDRLRRRCLLPGEERGPGLAPRNPFGAAAVGRPRNGRERLRLEVGISGGRQEAPRRGERRAEALLQLSSVGRLGYGALRG